MGDLNTDATPDAGAPAMGGGDAATDATPDAGAPVTDAPVADAPADGAEAPKDGEGDAPEVAAA